MKSVDLNDAIDQMAALLDKPLPGKNSHCLEKLHENDCIVDNDGSILGLGIVKPKIKPREATAYEDKGPEEWRETYPKKKLRGMKYVPAHKKCVLVFENGQVLIINDNSEEATSYKVIEDSFNLKISTEFQVNNVCLVNSSQVVICCNKATLYSIKFPDSFHVTTLSQAKVPNLDDSTLIYSVVNTNNPNDMTEHLFCTSQGLFLRHSSGAKPSEPFVTNHDAPYQYIETFLGKPVYQAVLIDREQSRFAVHFAPHNLAIYDNVSKRVLREFTFPDLLSIYSMQTVMDLPCILLREKRAIALFNMDLNYKIQVRQEIQYYTQSIDLQTAYVGTNTKYPESIQILYIEHSMNPKKNNEIDSKLQAINIHAQKITTALSIRDK